MRVAAIDLGTNTCLLLIADVESGEIQKVLHDEARVVRLGQGVHHSRQFHPEALQRVEDCFSQFRQTISQHRVDRVIACATSAARDAANAQELFQIGRNFEIPIRVISGDKEAEYTFFGTIDRNQSEPVILIDIGGGSTEFIFGNNQGIQHKISLDIGAVRLTEMFISEHPIPTEQMIKLTQYVQERLQEVYRQFPHRAYAKLIAVAGTPTTLASIDMGLPFESDKVDGYKLTRAKVRQLVQQMAAMSVTERQSLAGMEPKRADVIVAGSLILMLASQCLNIGEMEVSVRGLRYGLAKFAEGGDHL